MNEPQRITDVPAPPARPEDGHKGTFGTVIVVGGSPTMIGAPAICAAAALRSGAGLVKLAVPRDILPFALTIEPSATGVGLPVLDEIDRVVEAIDRADPEGRAVLAVGPGMGPGVREWVMELLGGSRSVVLDADGLNALAESGTRVSGQGAARVLTPHPGEFRRLAEPFEIDDSPTDPASRPAAATRLAQAHDAVVVLKGRHTVVSDGRWLFINDTGNPAMATAGSGDVLTGVVASLMAQGMDAFPAACLAVHTHGLAADRWAERHGVSGLKAANLADELPGAFAALRG